jgi:mannose-6-phosphate isomerase-like protein (cupin superfamily)
MERGRLARQFLRKKRAAGTAAVRETEDTVITVIDLKAALGELKTLRGRTPETAEAEREGAFAKLSQYRDGGIFAAKFSGESAWERHPNGDEIVQIVEGKTTVHLMTDDGPQSIAVSAGMVIVVPQNTWHRFEAPDGVSLVTATPQPTEHLTFATDDPRGLDKPR